jgi:MFS family permease
VYYLTAAVFSIAGAVLLRKTKKFVVFYLWISFGTLASSLPTFLNFNLTYLSVAAFLLGASFGFGMPTCLAFFADSTTIENRGYLGGMILLVANVSTFPLALLLMKFDLLGGSIVIAVWRSLGFIMLFLLRPKESVDKTRKNVSFSLVFHNRSLVLYLVPWLMFSFIDRFEKLVIRDLLDSYHLTLLTEPMISGISAFIGGFLADRLGRKRIVMYCFVAFGLAYAIISIGPTTLFSWYIYLAVDGIALGMLLVTFILILWGDLSQSGTREKYYVIGSLPFFLANIVPMFSVPIITLIPPYAAFSFASFFLFLAVLPLMYAPETLPKRKIQLRQLRSYAEAAKKLREKYLKKSDSAN